MRSVIEDSAIACAYYLLEGHCGIACVGDKLVELGDIRSVVFVMVKVQRLGRDIGLESVIGIRQLHDREECRSNGR